MIQILHLHLKTRLADQAYAGTRNNSALNICNFETLADSESYKEYEEFLSD